MTTQPRTLVLRADADSRTGAGHVMRGLALAQEWQGQGGEAVFVGHIQGGPLRQRLESEGIQVYNLPAAHPDPLDLDTFLPWLHVRHGQAGWLAIDGYHFDPSYHQALRATGWPLLVIDDYAHLPVYHADILVNPNAYAAEMPYRTEAQTLILRGASFAMLRKEFRQAMAQRNVEEGGREWRSGLHILVTMGGADPDNTTAKVVDTLEALGRNDMEVTIIVGPLNPHSLALNERLRHADLKVKVLTSVTDMVPIIQSADLAISAAGSTCWELAALGVPMVVTVLADNQNQIAASLADHGVAINLGWHHEWQTGQAASVLSDLMDNVQKRQAMGRKGQQLIDGLGTNRIIKHLGGVAS